MANRQGRVAQDTLNTSRTTKGVLPPHLLSFSGNTFSSDVVVGLIEFYTDELTACSLKSYASSSTTHKWVEDSGSIREPRKQPLDHIDRLCRGMKLLERSRVLAEHFRRSIS